jgi:hypothetical protein
MAVAPFLCATHHYPGPIRARAIIRAMVAESFVAASMILPSTRDASIELVPDDFSQPFAPFFPQWYSDKGARVQIINDYHTAKRDHK